MGFGMRKLPSFRNSSDWLKWVSLESRFSYWRKGLTFISGRLSRGNFDACANLHRGLFMRSWCHDVMGLGDWAHENGRMNMKHHRSRCALCPFFQNSAVSTVAARLHSLSFVLSQLLLSASHACRSVRRYLDLLSHLSFSFLQRQRCHHQFHHHPYHAPACDCPDIHGYTAHGRAREREQPFSMVGYPTLRKVEHGCFGVVGVEKEVDALGADPAEFGDDGHEG